MRFWPWILSPSPIAINIETWMSWLWPWMTCPEDKNFVTETAPLPQENRGAKPARNARSVTTKANANKGRQTALMTSRLVAPDEDSCKLRHLEDPHSPLQTQNAIEDAKTLQIPMNLAPSRIWTSDPPKPTGRKVHTFRGDKWGTWLELVTSRSNSTTTTAAYCGYRGYSLCSSRCNSNTSHSCKQ